MNRQLRRLTVARLALSLALVGPAAVHAEESPFPASGWYGVVPPAPGGSSYSGPESPFPASGWYGVVPPAPGGSNYSGRFDGSYGGTYSTGSHGGAQVVGGALNVAMRLFPPLMLVALPVVAVALVVKEIDSAVSNAKSGE